MTGTNGTMEDAWVDKLKAFAGRFSVRTKIMGIVLIMTTILGLGITFAFGLLFLIVFASKLLPERKELMAQLGETKREYIVEMMIQPTCPLIGKSVQEAGLRQLPGLFLMIASGGLLARLNLGPLHVGIATLDIHSMQIASLGLIVGYQAVTTAIAARIYAVAEEIGPPAPWMQRAFKVFTLERGLIAGSLVLLIGLSFIGSAVWDWARTDFGPLVPSVTMRPVLVGATGVALGMQTLLMSFLYSMLGIRRRGSGPKA